MGTKNPWCFYPKERFVIALGMPRLFREAVVEVAYEACEYPGVRIDGEEQPYVTIYMGTVGERGVPGELPDATMDAFSMLHKREMRAHQCVAMESLGQVYLGMYEPYAMKQYRAMLERLFASYVTPYGSPALFQPFVLLGQEARTQSRSIDLDDERLCASPETLLFGVLDNDGYIVPVTHKARNRRAVVRDRVWHPI